MDETLQAAFDVWSEYTDLKFTHDKSSTNVHIEVRFESGEHGDGDPFDGRGGTLAHAFFPVSLLFLNISLFFDDLFFLKVFGGDAHFDAAEEWTINTYRGTNLFQVAAHEFGHSLGLSHSDVRTALMAPFYRGYEPAFQLDIDDIQGIQALYGKKSRGIGGRTTTKPPRTTEAPPHGGDETLLCKDSKIDTIFNSAQGETYVFKDKYYWKLTEESIEAGYPKLISKGWPGLSGNIDAAFTYKNGKTYFFKGRKYWRYIGKKMDGNYPKDISEGFSGIPDDVDSAMVWSGNGKIYFFKGSCLCHLN